MVSTMSLLIPILVSAVVVFIASSIVHMVLPFHKGDMKQLPQEDAVLAALRKFNIPPGDYVLPHCSSMEAMKSPEFIEKKKQGPSGFVTILPPGMTGMGGSLAMWFLFSVLVSLFAGYVAGIALAPGANYLRVFQIVGTTAFMGYAFAQMQQSIWYKRNWGTTFRIMLDGFVYGLLTAGVFGWLWPR
ncbi:MAG TPA: hypothetical protein VFX92_00190 [Candidatus Krumholzibacteria bacterium]|nr:hypothetical protein [Candidatus Krumholzibacteria bacterium]